MLAAEIFNVTSGSGPVTGFTQPNPPTYIMTHVQQCHGLARIILVLGLAPILWKLSFLSRYF